jgi:hypothetical protein
LLARRINSLADRQVAAVEPFPAWPHWPVELARKFDRLAAPTMRRLGYYPPQATGVQAPLATEACA